MTYSSPRRPAGGGRRRRVLGGSPPDRRATGRIRGRTLHARRGGGRCLLGVGAGLHRHGDRRHHPQRSSHRRLRCRSARRTNRPRSVKPRPVAQHEPSGGGRSIPQHVRLSAREARPTGADRIEQRTAGVLRRTRIRRNRAEIAAVGSLLAAEAVEMTGAPANYPSPGPHCLACEFRSPCLAMFEGSDPEPLTAIHLQRICSRAAEAEQLEPPHDQLRRARHRVRQRGRDPRASSSRSSTSGRKAADQQMTLSRPRALCSTASGAGAGRCREARILFTNGARLHAGSGGRGVAFAEYPPDLHRHAHRTDRRNQYVRRHADLVVDLRSSGSVRSGGRGSAGQLG